VLVVERKEGGRGERPLFGLAGTVGVMRCMDGMTWSARRRATQGHVHFLHQFMHNDPFESVTTNISLYIHRMVTELIVGGARCVGGCMWARLQTARSYVTSLAIRNGGVSPRFLFFVH
jgi:hypothetical protein